MIADRAETKPARSPWTGLVIRLIGGAIIRAIYRIRVVHPENLPARGGTLLLPNHVTFADAFFISSACPRPVRFVMDEAFMKSRAIRIFVSIFDTMTIRREQPLEAIRSMIKALKNGDLVCLFPEGQLTRTGTLSELRRGFELTAKKAGHPLIPMWCDGSWGSVFSFERGRFIRKRPYRMPYGMRIAFGSEIQPRDASLEVVRSGLLAASAAAMRDRLQEPGQDGRMQVNGHQIGQVNALQWRGSFQMLKDEQLDMPGLLVWFPDIFEVRVEMLEETGPGTWVGGDHLRARFENTPPLAGEAVFYDFGSRAIDPMQVAGVLHLPSLAIDGVVISMSMPQPAKNQEADEIQHGHKPGSWGKLLPGWFLSGSRVHGPAAPDEGLELPAGAFLDPEGFLTRTEPIL